jgi:hypothetical protein
MLRRQLLEVTFKVEGAEGVSKSPAELRVAACHSAFSLFIAKLQVSIIVSERAAEKLVRGHFLTLTRVPPIELGGALQTVIVKGPAPA